MKKLLILLSVLLLSTALFAGEAGRPIKKQFVSEQGDTLNYQVLLPANYTPDEKYPLVLFLHGAGERGNNNESQLTNGTLETFANAEAYANFPAIVLYPQCPTNDFWVELTPNTRTNNNKENWFLQNPELSKSMTGVIALMDKYITEGCVDQSRIYVMGLSMGGMGTFDLICRYPDRFAAAIPICGGVHPARLKACAGKVAVRIFHGAADDVVKPEYSREAYAALKKAKASVTYTEYPGVNHGSWVPALKESDLLPWLFSQQKSAPKAKKK